MPVTIVECYRVYFGKDGSELVILLHGGHKKTQAADIKAAKVLWKDYKARKNSRSKGGRAGKKEAKKWH